MEFSDSGQVVCDGKYCVMFGPGYGSTELFVNFRSGCGLTPNGIFKFESSCMSTEIIWSCLDRVAVRCHFFSNSVRVVG